MQFICKKQKGRGRGNGNRSQIYSEAYYSFSAHSNNPLKAITNKLNFLGHHERSSVEEATHRL